jgi:hypothetical protein
VTTKTPQRNISDILRSKKILIGILIVILATGWWWTRKEIKKNIPGQEGVCGPKAMGSGYDMSYCNKSCDIDIDCKFSCGCGAINKDEIFHDEGIIYDCVDRYVKCEEKKCIVIEEKLSKQ